MSYFVEETLSPLNERSVVLVDENYRIVEDVSKFLHYIKLRGLTENTIESYCRSLRIYYNWLKKTI